MSTLNGRRKAGRGARTTPGTTPMAGATAIGGQAVSGAGVAPGPIPPNEATANPGVTASNQIFAPRLHSAVLGRKGRRALLRWPKITGSEIFQPLQISNLITALIALLVAFISYNGGVPEPNGHFVASLVLLVIGAISAIGFIATLMACKESLRTGVLHWKHVIMMLVFVIGAILLPIWSIEEYQQGSHLQTQLSDRVAIDQTIHAFVAGEIIWYKDPSAGPSASLLATVATPSQGGYVIQERKAWVQDVLIGRHQHYAPDAYGNPDVDENQIHITGNAATVQDSEQVHQPMLVLNIHTHTYRLQQLQDAYTHSMYELIKIGRRWLITGDV